MALLIAALALFVAFHFLPFYGAGARGFHVWLGVRYVLEHPTSTIEEPWFVMGMACFLNIALLIMVSPFLTQVWAKSRLAWWLATIFSGLAAVGHWLVFLVVYPSDTPPNWGGWCLMISPALNFVGLLLARPQWLTKSGLPFPPESHSAS